MRLSEIAGHLKEYKEILDGEITYVETNKHFPVVEVCIDKWKRLVLVTDIEKVIKLVEIYEMYDYEIVLNNLLVVYGHEDIAILDLNNMQQAKIYTR